MINRFLKAKHWQIFLFGFGIPFVVQMILFGFLMVQMTQLQNIENPADLLSTGIVGSYAAIILISLLSALVLYGWMYSVGVGLKKFLPANVPSRTKFFVFCLLFPFAYIILFFFIYVKSFFSIFEGLATESPESAVGGVMGVFFLIIPLHLFAMFCGIYVLRFVAKIIKSAELQRRARLSDYIGYFFLVWFYPIGIWILQPEINKIVAGDKPEAFSESGVLDA